MDYLTTNLIALLIAVIISIYILGRTIEEGWWN